MKKAGKVFIIAEAGVNHNGKLAIALKLCKKAKEAGADAVKFQTFITDNVITPNAPSAEYQKRNIKKRISQYDMSKGLELKFKDFKKIYDYCGKIGIEFMSTPDDEESLAFLMSLGMKVIKIGSGEVTNIPHLLKVAARKKDVILSTGMSTLDEVEIAYRTLKKAGARSVSLLHCTTNYPCPIEEVNLNAMLTLKNHFKTRVGYSDHTLSFEVPIAAAALGAEIIEKHMTLDKQMEGPDHKASFNPEQFTKMVKAVRNIEKAMGDGVKRATSSEKKLKRIVRRVIVASKSLIKGQVICINDICMKRSDRGIGAEEYVYIVGKRINADIGKDEPVLKKHISNYDRTIKKSFKDIVS